VEFIRFFVYQQGKYTLVVAKIFSGDGVITEVLLTIDAMVMNIYNVLGINMAKELLPSVS